jgi:hypothetical protein
MTQLLKGVRSYPPPPLTPIASEYWIIYRRPGFLAIVWYGPSSISPVSKLGRRSHRKWELADGRRRVGEEPNHTTHKKAWSSIIHSILSAHNWLAVQWRLLQPVLLYVYVAPELIPRNEFRQPMEPGGPVRKPYSSSVPSPHRLFKDSSSVHSVLQG